MASSTKEPACASCGVPWVDHLGIVGTCARLAEANAKMAELEALRVRETAKEPPPDDQSMLVLAWMRGTHAPKWAKARGWWEEATASNVREKPAHFPYWMPYPGCPVKQAKEPDHE